MFKKLLLLVIAIFVLGLGNYSSKAATSLTPGNLLIPNAGLNVLQEFNPRTKSVIQSIPIPTPYYLASPTQLNELTALIREGDNTIFINVRDSNNAPMLLALSESGQLLAVKETNTGWLQQIAFDPVDPTGNTIIGGIPASFKIAAINPFDGIMTDKISLNNANFIGLITDANGQIYAGNHQAGKVLIYDKYGNFQGLFADVPSPGYFEINGMAFDGNGNLYVAQNSYNRIVKFSPNGVLLGFITNSSFNHPASVFFNPNDGLLYIGNIQDDKLIILTTTGEQIDVISLGGGFFLGIPALVPTRIVVNVPPTVDINQVNSINEGDTLLGSGSFNDPDSNTWTATVDYGDGIGIEPLTLNPNNTFAINHTYIDNGNFTVKVCVSDDDGGIGCDTEQVVVSNISPTIQSISAPNTPVQIGISVFVGANFTDPGTADTHTAIWDWGDGNTSPGTINEANGSGSASGSHSYTNPGVYTIILTITDKDGGYGSATYHYIVVYDPNGGFVTGGGWIWSPLGAYVVDPMLEGKASFGFVSRYKKGATVPDGTTEFQFKAGDLNFHSTSYQWLVVNQNYTNAQFKGYGTINGTGNYGFMLWSTDTSPDTFRIKIWNADDDAVIYDNGVAQPIGGGNIVVHK